MKEHHHFKRPDPDTQEIWTVTTSSDQLDWLTETAANLVRTKKAATVDIAGPNITFANVDGIVTEKREWRLTARCSSATMLACARAIKERHPNPIPPIEAESIQYIDPAYRSSVVDICEISEVHVEKLTGAQI